MIFYPADYERAAVYWQEKPFPYLSTLQKEAIQSWGRELLQFHLRHPVIHHLIGGGVFLLLFSLDWFVLMRLGRYAASPLASGVLVGLAHGYLMYSLAVYTLHEGAAHKLIVLRKSRVSRGIASLAANISRITTAEPDYYAPSHMSHHARFATRGDEEFLNYVSRNRFLKAFLPYALFFGFSDFRAHAGGAWTRSKAVSFVVFFAYHGLYAAAMLREQSWAAVVIALAVVFPHCATWLDRVRQYMEHNLMPLDSVNGARDLGTGFWGMLVGGGPWGQPCHWSHHLFPGIPWYAQLRMHGKVRSLLTPEQRNSFYYKPLFGFPCALARVMRET